jgi:predicted Zn-dependent protease
LNIDETVTKVGIFILIFIVIYPVTISLVESSLYDSLSIDKISDDYNENIEDIAKGNVAIWKPHCSSTNKFKIDKNDKNISVKWCSQKELHPNAAALTYLDSKVYLNKNISDRFLPSYLFHELGHTLGYSHKAGGVMSYDTISQPMKEEKYLNYTTRSIAKEFDSYKIIDWNEEDLEFLESEYNDGNISKDTWERMNEYSLSSYTYSTVYYKHYYNNHNYVVDFDRRFYRKPWLYR